MQTFYYKQTLYTDKLNQSLTFRCVIHLHQSENEWRIKCRQLADAGPGPAIERGWMCRPQAVGGS